MHIADNQHLVKRIRPEFIAITLLSIGFLLWSRAFIGLSSFETIDGKRTFSLFDDAMISMRYAWNFAHGNGLVWNAGQPVQGYTNLLMTLLMSIATFLFSKPMAVLAIQISGVLFMLLIAWLSMQIADHVLQIGEGALGTLLRVLAFASGLAYYPLLYWSLMGMETGLETVLLLAGILCALQYSRSHESRAVLASAVYFGLAFLTRNETIIFFVAVWIYLAYTIKKSHCLAYRQLLGFAALVLMIACAELLFQYRYYGAFLPNTYTLKLTGMPILYRLQNGVAYVLPFLRQTFLLLVFGTLGLLLHRTMEKVLLGSVFVLALGYQIYVGGDGWNYWRMLSPAIPLVMILSLEGLSSLVGLIAEARKVVRQDSLGARSSSSLFVACAVMPLWAAAATLANLYFFTQMTLAVSPYQACENQQHANTALALNDLLREHATIGVFWAGTLSYYTDFDAVDFLGKSDRYIANLPPDMSGSIGRDAVTSLPGHNKYDLQYSIVGLRPTYVQGFQWASQDLSTWAPSTYVQVQYRGVTLDLLKDSPDVRWGKLSLP